MRPLIGLLAALLTALLVATAAHATDQGEPMKDASTPRTLCLGRFLVDVPKDVVITGQSSDYRWDGVSVTKRVSEEAFQRFIADKEKMLKETRHKTESSLLKHISKSSDGASVVMVFWETPTSRHGYKTEAYKWMKGYQYLIKGEVDDDKSASALGMLGKSISELQYRREDEIPTTPGFCIDGGFFAGEPGLPHYESTFFNLQLKSHPDVRITIETSTNGEKVDEGLLARVDKKKYPVIYAELAKQIKTLRRGQHPVGDIQAEELLEAFPTGETFFTHLLRWESAGKPRDIYAPGIIVEMKTGQPSPGSYGPPSVTDKQAIELFDSIVNSIRIRPAGTPAVQKPGKQSKAPLGTSLLSGETCPQSGDWECYHEQAEGERLRFFAEGEVLPEVLLPVPLTPWQKLRGEPASRLFKTHWALRRLPDNES